MVPRILAASLIAAGLSAPVIAEEIFYAPSPKNPNTIVILYPERPCTNPQVIRHIKDEFVDRFMEAGGTLNGKKLTICATYFPEDKTVGLVNDKGEAVTLPLKIFKRPI